MKMSIGQIDSVILEAMEREVLDFKKGKARLPDLVNNLSAGLQGMIEILDTWKTEFTEKWFLVEVVNALALDAGRTEALEGDKEYLNRALDDLLAHIRKGKGVH